VKVCALAFGWACQFASVMLSLLPMESALPMRLQLMKASA
jgi:hypothetical protein